MIEKMYVVHDSHGEMVAKSLTPKERTSWSKLLPAWAVGIMRQLGYTCRAILLVEPALMTKIIDVLDQVVNEPDDPDIDRGCEALLKQLKEEMK